ncbi:MAG: hypothetical protein ABI432_16825 [Flavobacteriales bacterium]
MTGWLSPLDMGGRRAQKVDDLGPVIIVPGANVAKAQPGTKQPTKGRLPKRKRRLRPEEHRDDVRLTIDGARTVPEEAKKELFIPTVWLSQFETAQEERGCFDAAVLMTLSGVRDKLVGGGEDGRIAMVRSSNEHGRVTPDPEGAAEGLAYVDRMLEKNIRVLAGVSYWGNDGAAAQDKLGTRHFVTIIGRSYEAIPGGGPERMFYVFMDPAKKREFAEKVDGHEVYAGKLYVDNATGILFKRGEGPQRGSGFVGKRDYEVTHVRVYKGTR